MTERSFTQSLEVRGLLPLVTEVAASHHVTLFELASRNRTAHVSRARRECWRRLRGLGFSYEVIGALFDRDHSSVMWSLKRSA